MYNVAGGSMEIFDTFGLEGGGLKIITFDGRPL